MATPIEAGDPAMTEADEQELAGPGDVAVSVPSTGVLYGKDGQILQPRAVGHDGARVDHAESVASEEDSPHCPLLSLPEEMVVKVLLLLDAESVARFGATSR
jgi:hypothetical protein